MLRKIHGSLAAVLVATLLALLGAGCGSGEEDGSDTAAEATAPAADAGEEGSQPDVAGADAEDVEVIEAWIGALSEGDTEAAAELFALPSTAENGTLLVPIRELSDAVAFNESLPCGGELIAAATTGDFTTATFRLTERPGGACGAGTGGTASTAFVIDDDGLIRDWRRVTGEGDPEAPGAAGEAI